MEHLHTLVLDYLERGFAPIPVEFKRKECKINGWQNLKLTAEEVQRFFELPCNVGVVLGDASGGLVDIDLDCQAAIDLAPHILPSTGMVFGRASRPRSHWIYKASNIGKKQSFAHPEHGMLVELRANGCMTVFPGSVHESGEEIVFDMNDSPAEMDFDQLQAYGRQLGAASLILPHWEKGNRHNLSLAVSGTLLKGGFTEDNAHRFIEAMVRAADDDEGEDRHQCISSTAAKMKAGQPITGKKDLADVVGEKSADRFCEWSGLGGESERIPSAAKAGDLAQAFGGPAPQSDVANAERFAAHHGDKAAYCPELKRWLIWNGCRWAQDDGGGQVMRLARSVAREIGFEAVAKGDRESHQWAAKVNDLQRLRSMLSVAQSDCEATLGSFDADLWRLNCRSGILDLHTGEHARHDPGALMRRLAPVSFDADAQCPTFLAFLDRVFAADAGVIGFLQRAIGYCLTGKTHEECLFVLVGNGANGKSTLIRVIQDLLGDYAQQTPMDTLMVSRSGNIPNDLARLEGARFVSAVEAEAGQRLAEAKIKQLTGGDRITARFLHGEFFTFTPQLKLWLATNKLPEIKGTDEGIWRRIYVIPFNVTIPKEERDHTLSEKLRSELPGILNWAVAGCLSWQNTGLRPPDTVKEATREYRAEMDLVTQFLEDCCVSGPNESVTANVIYSTYTEWCHQNGYAIMSQRSFGQRLNELRYEAFRSGMARKRRGIRLKTDLEMHTSDLEKDFEPKAPDARSDTSDKYVDDLPLTE